MRKKTKKTLKKIWYFIWEEDSVWSWIVNIILAFVLIKFIVYPGLGAILSTTHPIVAVVSSSMEHNGDFDEWWSNTNTWYEENNISKTSFIEFKFKNGFNKGDIMILKGRKSEDIKIGDIIVFQSHKTKPKPDPIIHRVVKIENKNNTYYFQTKGDNYKTNKNQIKGCDKTGCIDEKNIAQEQIIGSAMVKVPLLGYIKIWFVELLKLFIR